MEGYTGSDIKEVCREAVVRISHEAAALLERTGMLPPSLPLATLAASQASASTSASTSASISSSTDSPDAALKEKALGEAASVSMGFDGARDSSESVSWDLSVASSEALRLRPVARADLERAIKKLSASVNGRGREVTRVAEWNEQYGEIKKAKKRPALSMYL